MFVSDLRHFLDLPPDLPAPARRMAEHLTLIVRAATAGDGGLPWVSALPCMRRPGRRPCPGFLCLLRTDVPPSIEWRCTSCLDDGVVSGWDRSPFDLRTHNADHVPAGGVRAVITSDVAAALRSLMLVDSDGERVIFRTSVSTEGIVLVGSEDDLNDLLGYVAAEANHEKDRRRQKRLDAAFQALSEVLDETTPS